MVSRVGDSGSKLVIIRTWWLVTEDIAGSLGRVRYLCPNVEGTGKCLWSPEGIEDGVQRILGSVVGQHEE